MRVLMISLDRGLLGEGFSGDVVERHKQYAELAGHLDIIVFAGSQYERKDWASNLGVIPTRSRRNSHFKNAVKIAISLAKQRPYDLLVTQDLAAPAGAEIKKVNQIPWIVNIHSMFFSSQWLRLKPVNWYLFYLVKKAIQFADGFRVNNEVIQQKLVEWGITKPILIQPTPVDVSKFFKDRNIPPQSPLTLRGEEGGIGRGSEGELLKILYVGRLSPEKNILMLIGAFKKLSGDLELQIVGMGTEAEKLKQLAQGNERIKFLGPKTIEELPAIFQKAEIFVLPSNTESFGQVLLQAAAAGCAIVATKTAGALGIIQDQESGILIEVGDQTGLERVLQKLITDGGLRARLGSKAQMAARQFDSDAGISKTVNFWKEVIGT